MAIIGNFKVGRPALVRVAPRALSIGLRSARRARSLLLRRPVLWMYSCHGMACCSEQGGALLSSGVAGFQTLLKVGPAGSRDVNVTQKKHSGLLSGAQQYVWQALRGAAGCFTHTLSAHVPVRVALYSDAVQGKRARAQGRLRASTLAATAASARPCLSSGPAETPQRGGGPASAWAVAAAASSSARACTPPRTAPRAPAPRRPSARTWAARSTFDVWPWPGLQAEPAMQGGGRADRAMCSGEWPTRPSAMMRRPKRRSGSAYGVSAYRAKSWLSALSQIWRRARAQGHPACQALTCTPARSGGRSHAQPLTGSAPRPWGVQPQAAAAGEAGAHRRGDGARPCRPAPQK